MHLRSALALRQQHVQNRPRGPVAEELPQRFLMPSDPVLLHQLDKMAGLVERQCRLGKVRIFRDEIMRVRNGDW